MTKRKKELVKAWCVSILFTLLTAFLCWFSSLAFMGQVTALKQFSTMEADFNQLYTADHLRFTLQLYSPSFYGVSTQEEAIEKIDRELREKCPEFLGLYNTQPQLFNMFLSSATNEDGKKININNYLVTYPVWKNTNQYYELDKELMCRAYTTDEEVPIYVSGELAKTFPLGSFVGFSYDVMNTPPGTTQQQESGTVRMKVVGVIEKTSYILTNTATAPYEHWQIAIPKLIRPDGGALGTTNSFQPVALALKTEGGKPITSAIEMISPYGSLSGDASNLLEEFRASPEKNSFGQLYSAFLLTLLCLALLLVLAVVFWNRQIQKMSKNENFGLRIIIGILAGCGALFLLVFLFSSSGITLVDSSTSWLYHARLPYYYFSGSGATPSFPLYCGIVFLALTALLTAAAAVVRRLFKRKAG